VQNVAPTANADGPYNVAEGSTLTLTGTITDPGTLDTFTLDVDWGPNDIEQYSFAAGTTSFSLTHQYLDDNPTGTPQDTYTISATVTDDDAGVDSDTETVLVTNIVPELVPDTVGTSATKDNKAVVGNVVSVSAQFTDVGTLDTHTVIVDWDDGSTSNSDLDPSDFSTFVDSTGGGAESFTGIHTYSTGGIFTVVVTVIDDDTGLVTDSTVLAWVSGVRLTPQGILQIVGTSDDEDLSEATVFADTYITMGVSSAVGGDLQSGTAVTLGASAEVDDTIQYGTAITYGAGATSGGDAQAIADGRQGVIEAQSALDGMTDTGALAPGNIAADVTFAAGVYDVPGLLTVAADITITLDAAG